MQSKAKKVIEIKLFKQEKKETFGFRIFCKAGKLADFSIPAGEKAQNKLAKASTPNRKKLEMQRIPGLGAF